MIGGDQEPDPASLDRSAISPEFAGQSDACGGLYKNSCPASGQREVRLYRRTQKGATIATITIDSPMVVTTLRTCPRGSGCSPAVAKKLTARSDQEERSAIVIGRAVSSLRLGIPAMVVMILCALAVGWRPSGYVFGGSIKSRAGTIAPI